MEKIFSWLWMAACIGAIGVIAILMLSIAGCTPKIDQSPAYTSVCGDRVCSPGEEGKCDVDCYKPTQVEQGADAVIFNTSQDYLEELKQRVRQYTPEERQGMNTTNTAVQDDKKIIVESIEDYLPSIGFRVANRYNLLALNENISGVMGTLTGYNMREVLGGGRLSSNTGAFGPRVALYEQFLTLRSGRVVFGFEEESEKVTTYLQFKEGEPIFEYLLRINGGIFKFFEKQQIHFLGHDYTIEQVDNNSMVFIGVTTPDSIMFRNGHGILVNDKQISPEVINVTVGMDYLRVVIMAEDDISILPGSSLVEKLSNRAVLLTNRLDLEYLGLTDAPTINTLFERINNRYRLKIINNLNMSYDIPLVYLSPFKTGGEDYNLVFQEGASSSDYNIRRNDYFIISNNKELNGITSLIRLLDISAEDGLLTFQDPALEKFYVYFEGTPGTNATADLLIYNVHHKVNIGANKTMSADMNGDGAINGGKPSIVTAGNGIIRINRLVNGQLNISFITPKELRENAKTNLETVIIVNNDAIRVDKGGLVLEESPDSDTLLGLNDYGTAFILKKNVDDDQQSGEDLLIINPVYQRFADVVVKAYE
ncbi:MAG: hypothetical protein V1866_02625 [archaeon]